mgnify:CR=1 FL=1
MIIVLGSNNKHKAKEINNILSISNLSGIEIKTLSDLINKAIDVEENGKTLEENAQIKAKFYYYHFLLPTIADDTGLEVDILDGLPGVYSARFSGSYGNDKANRRKLIDMLMPYPQEFWTARFRTVICLYDKGQAHYAEGICKGRIIDEERGEGGFGYDSIFIPEGFTKTFAEMSFEEKNLISHRANAINNFVKLIKELYKL